MWPAPSKPGTYEAATSMWTAVLGLVGLFAEGCGTGYGYDPHYKAKDCAQFVHFTEKLLLKCPSFVPGSRVMIKGHMLYAAPQLASIYPGATFVCVLHDPEQQIRSSINWLHELSPALSHFSVSAVARHAETRWWRRCKRLAGTGRRRLRLWRR